MVERAGKQHTLPRGTLGEINHSAKFWRETKIFFPPTIFAERNTRRRKPPGKEMARGEISFPAHILRREKHSAKTTTRRRNGAGRNFVSRPKLCRVGHSAKGGSITTPVGPTGWCHVSLLFAMTTALPSVFFARCRENGSSPSAPLGEVYFRRVV